MYLLWQFETTKGVVVTRGETVEQAKRYIAEICGDTIITTFTHCNVNAAYLYSQSHPFNWLQSPMRWLEPSAKWLPIDRSFGEQFRK